MCFSESWRARGPSKPAKRAKPPKPAKPAKQRRARSGDEKQKLTQTDGAENRLALVVVHPDAVVLAGGKTVFGTYDLFVRANLDDRIQNEIRKGLREVIVDARVRAAGLERRHLEALTSVARVSSVTVTANSERETVLAYTRLLPMGFMVLLFMSVLTAGQALLTTTIEEKSSRVMEVILSAVSPMQLMAGKILACWCTESPRIWRPFSGGRDKGKLSALNRPVSQVGWPHAAVD